MTTALLADPICLRHKLGRGHPERPERYEAVVSALDGAGLMAQMLRIAPRAATADELAACHTREYIELVAAEVADGSRVLSTGDTDICPESLDVALAAAGGVLQAVDAVVEGRAQNAFCVVRPPGHHANADRGMGFCIFNNVALAARYAQRRHGLERVLIADWDVHHGNGTQDIFYADGSVFFFSTHQHPWYPGTGSAEETGEGAGRRTTLNCPFPAGSGRAEILGAFQQKLLPAARNFKPDLVLISAGFDSRAGDPLGGFTLSDGDFADLTALLLEIAGSYAGGRLVSVLEGGYSLEGLAAAAEAHVKALVTSP
jgi:acetoin utilization deacetylase AcuC-like enzyme